MNSTRRAARSNWRIAAAGYVLGAVIVAGTAWALLVRDSGPSGSDLGVPGASASAVPLGLAQGPPSPVPVAACEPTADGAPQPIEVIAGASLAEIGIDDPQALSYVPDGRTLLVADASGEMPVVTLFGDRAGSLADPDHPVATARYVRHPMLDATLAWNPGDVHLSVIPLTSDGGGDGTTPEASALDLRPLAVGALDHVTIDAATGDLYLAEVATARIVMVPFIPARARQAAVLDIETSCELRASVPAGSRLGAIAVQPGGGRLFAIEEAPGATRLHELDRDGRSLAVHDATALGIGPGSAMVTASRSNPNVQGTSVYLAESGPGEEGGEARLVELAIGKAPAVPVQHVGLVGATRTSQWPQPSPDPCGIAWDAANGRLVVTDPEVEELELFAGVNVFFLDASRQPVASSLTAFTSEPSDVAIDPVTGGYFVTDDSAARVYQAGVGPDGALGGDDDEISFLATDPFGSRDPDGLAVGQGGLFVSDGANDRVYRISPGPDGELTGIAPAGDDVVTSFDTATFGVTDPEAVAFDPRRGTLYLVTDDGRPRLVEVTTAGAALRTFDLGFLPITSAAGLTIAPSSDDPARESIYLVDRGVDRTIVPDQNDGLLFELRIEEGDHPDLAHNGGFESDINVDGVPDGWELYDAERVAGEGRNGDAAVRLAFDELAGSVRLEAPLPPDAQNGVVFSAWVRAAPGSVANAVARVAWRDATGVVLRNDRLASVSVGPTWTEISAAVIPPSGFTDARLSVEVHAGVAFVDDVSFVVVR